MRYVILSLLLGLIVVLAGCSDNAHVHGHSHSHSEESTHDHNEDTTPVTLTPEEKRLLDEELPRQDLTSIERFFNLPIEERTKKAAEWGNMYIQLKDKDFKAAVIALKKAAYIIAKGPNPLMREWLEIGTRILGVKEGLLVDLLRYNEIEIEIAQNNNEDKAYITKLKARRKEVQAAVDHLKSQGVDPTVFKVEFQPPDKSDE